MRTAVITGSSGFIGTALTKALLQRGYIVYGIGTSKKRLDQFQQEKHFYPIIASFDQYKEIDQIVPPGIDVFFHLANKGELRGNDLLDVALQIENISGACKACEMAILLKSKRFVFVSSSYQYMRNIKSNQFDNIYGRAKLAAEQLCGALLANSNTKFYIAVLSNTFGVGDYSSKAVNTMLKKLLNKEDLNLISGTRKNDWVYIDDTVEGLIALGEKANKQGKYYIGHLNIPIFKNIIIEMRDIISPNSNLYFGKYEETSYVDYSELDARVLKKETGFECHCDFRKSILQTVDFIKHIATKEDKDEKS